MIAFVPDDPREAAAVARRLGRREGRERGERERTPSSATGTLWKLRAKLTERRCPPASLEATAVKNRNVIGSIGWLDHLGEHEAEELAHGRHPDVEPRPDPEASSARMPTTRIPRWSSAPSTAPMAAAKIPSRS